MNCIDSALRLLETNWKWKVIIASIKNTFLNFAQHLTFTLSSVDSGGGACVWIYLSIGGLCLFAEEVNQFSWTISWREHSFHCFIGICCSWLCCELNYYHHYHHHQRYIDKRAQFLRNVIAENSDEPFWSWVTVLMPHFMEKCADCGDTDMMM